MVCPAVHASAFSGTSPDVFEQTSSLVSKSVKVAKQNSRRNFTRFHPTHLQSLIMHENDVFKTQSYKYVKKALNSRLQK